LSKGPALAGGVVKEHGTFHRNFGKIIHRQVIDSIEPPKVFLRRNSVCKGLGLLQHPQSQPWDRETFTTSHDRCSMAECQWVLRGDRAVDGGRFVGDLEGMVHPEGFEPPTLWFVVAGESIFTDYCGCLRSARNPLFIRASTLLPLLPMTAVCCLESPVFPPVRQRWKSQPAERHLTIVDSPQLLSRTRQTAGRCTLNAAPRPRNPQGIGA